MFPGRYFRQTLVTTAHHVNAAAASARTASTGSSSRSPATQQLGTHLDALNHLQIGDRAYNGWTVAELAGTAGVTRLGVETVPQIVTRGWLVDVAGRGAGRRRRDRRSTTSRGIEPEPGDAVLFHTGLGRALGRRRRPTSPASPGPGCALAEWLVERGVALTGCDTWSYGPVPAEDPDAAVRGARRSSTSRHGVFIVENLDLRARRRRRARVRARSSPTPSCAAPPAPGPRPIALV